MANLKPQSPLTYMDDYIFPLTSADQVIIDEQGRRLDSVIGDMLRVEEIASSGGGVAINAASVQGKTPQDIYNTLYPVGSVYTSSTAANPSSSLGFGTWQLIGKEFKDINITDSSGTYFTPHSNTSSFTLTCCRSGTAMSFKILFVNGVAITDTAGENIGTFNLSSLGIAEFPFSMLYMMAGSDTANDTLMCYVKPNGELTVADIVATSSVAKANNNYLYFSVNFPQDLMLDSACDKFHWKRTA